MGSGVLGLLGQWSGIALFKSPILVAIDFVTIAGGAAVYAGMLELPEWAKLIKESEPEPKKKSKSNYGTGYTYGISGLPPEETSYYSRGLL